MKTEIQVMQPMTIRFNGKYCDTNYCDNYFKDGYYCADQEDGNICIRYPRAWAQNLKFDGIDIVRHPRCIKEFGDGKTQPKPISDV